MRVRLPRFQIIFYDPNAYVINHYNLLVASKNYSKKILYSKQNMNLIKILLKTGALSHYTLVKYTNTRSKFFKKNVNVFFIKFAIYHFKNSPFFKTIRLISTQSKSFTITLQTIKLVTPIFKTSLFILSTPKGLLTHKEALKLGTGGILICSLN